MGRQFGQRQSLRDGPENHVVSRLNLSLNLDGDGMKQRAIPGQILNLSNCVQPTKRQTAELACLGFAHNDPGGDEHL